jgi:hypothetical protein
MRKADQPMEDAQEQDVPENGWSAGYREIGPSGSEGSTSKPGREPDQGAVCLPYCRESGQKAKAL